MKDACLGSDSASICNPPGRGNLEGTPNPQQEPCCDWQNSSANTSNWSDRKTEASRKQAAQRGAKNAFKQRGIGKDRHRHDRVAGFPGGPGDPLGSPRGRWSRKGQICLGGEQERSGASPRCRRRPRRCRRSSCGCSSRPPWRRGRRGRGRRISRSTTPTAAAWSGAERVKTARACRFPARAQWRARSAPPPSPRSPPGAEPEPRRRQPRASSFASSPSRGRRVRVSVPVSSPPSW